MPNTTVRAAAEGMPNINRRRLINLAGAGLALAATVASVGKAPAETQAMKTGAKREPVSAGLRAAINEHKAKQAYWSSVCTCTDKAVIGRDPTEADEAKWHAASDGEFDALTALCRYPARTIADQVAKARYIRIYHSWRFGELQVEQVDALLLSMIHVRKGGQS